MHRSGRWACSGSFIGRYVITRRDTLRRHSPRLVIELHGAECARAVARFLHDAGYRIFGFLAIRGRSRSYREVLPADIELITGEYALHHCVAARDVAQLAPPSDFVI